MPSRNDNLHKKADILHEFAKTSDAIRRNHKLMKLGKEMLRTGNFDVNKITETTISIKDLERKCNGREKEKSLLLLVCSPEGPNSRSNLHYFV